MTGNRELERPRQALALLRITLGIIILATWYDNLTKGLYTAEGLVGFFNWLFAPDGNASSLGFFQAFLNGVIAPVAGVFAPIQMVAEFLMGLALLLGGVTRLAGVAAMLFFFNLLLSYWGGHEWIWTYVLLLASALAVTLGDAGRQWGLDIWLRARWKIPFSPADPAVVREA